ncbi:hypothetical protein FHT85_006019 [Rhizobium sp. BK312]|nr:hypothetical protein [Rhizobium sp. BK312]
MAEVQEIKRQVCAIVESAQEQSSGLRQINTAVNQLDQDTQKNAATVEEAMAANYSLANEVRTPESSQCPRRRGNGSLAAIEGEVRAFCTALGYDRFVPFSAFAAQDEMVERVGVPLQWPQGTALDEIGGDLVELPPAIEAAMSLDYKVLELRHRCAPARARARLRVL